MNIEPKMKPATHANSDIHDDQYIIITSYERCERLNNECVNALYVYASVCECVIFILNLYKKQDSQLIVKIVLYICLSCFFLRNEKEKITMENSFS